MDVLEISNTLGEEIIKPKKKRGRKPKPKDPNAKPRTPKKRGRKPKIKDPNAKPRVLKKRGRKPKPKTDDDNKPKVYKKRGRKKKENTYSIKKQSLISYDDPKNDTLIMYLPIRSSDLRNEILEDKLLRYNELTEPQPFENEINFETIKNTVKNDVKENEEKNTFAEFKGIIDNEEINNKYIENLKEINEIKNIQNDEKIKIDKDVSYSFKENRLVNIRWEFIDANNKKTWPLRTNSCCLWCCHKFDSIPVALPKYYMNEIFYVFGIFCSFNCTASYNFDKKDDQIWERYSLLNLMYKKLNECNFSKINLAPPRETLKIFSGHLSINEFRTSFLKQEKIFKMLEPPIISLIPKIEELITHNNNKNKKLYIPIDNNVLENARKSEKLKLSRSKPVLNQTSTLSRFMNLKIK
jgi:hypothetical protein